MPPIDPALIPKPGQARTLAGVTYVNPRAEAVRQEQTRTAIAQHNSARSDANDSARVAIAKQEFMQKYGYDPEHPPEQNKDNLGVGEAALKDLSPEEQAMVKAITIGKVPVTPYAMARSPQFARLVQHAFAYEPGTDLTLFQRRNAAYQKFFAPNAPTTRVNQAMQHLDVFWNAARALGNAKSSLVSLPENIAHAGAMSYEQSPKVTAFEHARNAVATELAAAFKGGNNPAEAQIVRDIQSASLHDSPEQLAQYVKTSAQLLHGRIAANQFQFQQMLGPNATADDLLSPEAKAAFDHYGSDDFGKDPQDLEPKALSTTSKAVQLPPGYQEDHADFLQHHPQLTPEEYVDFRNQTDKKYNVQSDLNPKMVNNFVDAFNQGGVNANVAVPANNNKLGPIGSTVQGALQSPVGTAVANATNAATGGLPELAAGQGDRDAFHILNAENPKSALAGDVLGSIAPLTGLEGGAFKLIDKLPLQNEARKKLISMLTGTTAYGTARGFNDADTGQEAEGAVAGGLEGLAGGAVGNFLGKGVNNLLSDRTLIALSKLKGVDLTTLQRLGLGRFENSFNMLPGVRGASAAAEDSMNQDFGNQVLSNVGAKLPDKYPGAVNDATARNQAIYNAADTAYNKVKPFVNGSRTGAFENGMTALKASAAKTAEEKDLYSTIEQASNQAFDANGHFNGEGYQSAMQGLRQAKQDFLDGAQNSTTPGLQRKMADAAQTAMGHLDSLAKDQLPASVYQDLNAADRTWAGMRKIQDMTNRALPGREGTYAPGDMLRTQMKFDPSVNNGMTSQGLSPGEDYALAAQHIMGPSPAPAKIATLPTMAEIGLGGTGLGLAPHLVGGIGATAAAGYFPGIKRVMQALLTGPRPAVLDNPATMNSLADAMRYFMNNSSQNGGQ